ncbi:protein of unknown function [Taphrina deformans PYCC 5710]|uniref:Mediator of RNA polymerase II transcription subunit 19 n=1 Tax=Taphrina deformans (strain PYCC 5710 / ATCC 11124 / CBS 356.35 / IMI 108563 / JCM 9778 / NBRC 8474) TaxID=1097556 RepID=R4XDI2_TAPDE|nr:protein of unknown function [Taphrina deformans PYCC 5710]|eukprot:CCG83646.1 protein of unknown function [Taphrina deformans PYCC 5710]
MTDTTTPAASLVYLVNSCRPEPANPSGMQNLQSVFGLDSLAASVARTDAQGNKIAANKLNKTYKKQVLDLALPGDTDIPKNRFLMDALLSGAAHRAVEDGYRQFTRAEVEDGFALRPGELNGYIKYRPPSPTPKRGGKVDSTGGTPTAASFFLPDRTAVSEPRSRTYSEPRTGRGSGTHNSSVHATRASTPSPIQTRSTAAHVPPPPPSVDGDESSDDGSRFKQLERERKKKLRMKREAEMALGGDYKRRRYDVDGYEFLDSD